MNGIVKINDLVYFESDSRGTKELFVVTNIDESRFMPEFQWSRTLTLKAFRGKGGFFDVEEAQVELHITGRDIKRLVAKQIEKHDLDDPRERLF